jgi:hypothetical protein
MRAPGSFMVAVDFISDKGESDMVDDSRTGIPPGAGGHISQTPENDPPPVVPEKRAERPEVEGQPEDGPLPEAVRKPGKKKGKKKKKKKAKTGPGRGVETMFRTSYRTHLDLSTLADNKANIMISINGIIISILLASIYPRIVDNRFLLFPTAVLLVFCLLSLVYAVLAARPRVTRREATLEDVRQDKANILFFGTFTTMKEEDFLQGMRELIKDPERAYGNMIRDIFGLGSVLETKYRLLRTSYTIFMVGLILGVTLFLAAFTWASGGTVGI